MNEDSFTKNIAGVTNLVESNDNKVNSDSGLEEGVLGDYEDILDLPMEDEELLELKRDYESRSAGYLPKIKGRQNMNRTYYKGTQRGVGSNGKVVTSNEIFTSLETFIPQALAQNPEPVVWSDNTDEGKLAANDLKTMLQYHADVFNLRKLLALMLRQWANYFLGVIKYGWNEKTQEIEVSFRKIQNFKLDPNGYVDRFGNFIGDFAGEMIESTAKELIEVYPKHKEYVLIKTNGKLGTKVIRTEWWNDEYCFTSFEDEILEKHRNEYFNYDTKEEDEYGSKTDTPGINHFAIPKMPYTFLSVFSLQEEPYDTTNLTEQSIPNQDSINDRDFQIGKNLASANNSVILSGLSFTTETASQAVDSFYEEGFILVPDGQIDQAVKRLAANDIPSAVFTAQENNRVALRSVYGVQGTTAQPKAEDTTAHGMVLNKSFDSTRIGGVSDALEQVADTFFNWLCQMYCVFYDTPHYGAIMGNGRAVEYVGIVNEDMKRKFVISVSPNSMKPKDEVSEQNMAVDLANAGWLDPINLFKRLNDPNPMETAKMVTLFRTNPQMYMQMYFPEAQPQQQQAGAPPGEGQIQEQPPAQEPALNAPEASQDLSNAPLPKI